MKLDMFSKNAQTDVVDAEWLEILNDIICIDDEFALLRDTLRLYREELESGVVVH